MNDKQVLIAIIGAVAIAGVTTYELSDGTKYDVPADAVDCSYQPVGSPPPPCFPDGGWDSKVATYRDAGCLAQVCAVNAEVLATGKSRFFKTAAEVQAKGALEAAPVSDPAVEVVAP